jgi:hypothetical protein
MLNIAQAVEIWTVMNTDGKYEFVITFLLSMDFFYLLASLADVMFYCI